MAQSGSSGSWQHDRTGRAGFFGRGHRRGAPAHQPYIPDDVIIPEFTWPAVLVGAVLGIVFGASSLYLVLKVGMTVSASIPVAVLSITLFRLFTRVFGVRRATILENNIVQTAGSAGESIAFGIGVTMPALLLLGFQMDLTRTMVVGVLGGLLGILMMIPLRRAFVVKQHGTLKYPEGTACAEVLIVGETGRHNRKNRVHRLRHRLRLSDPHAGVEDLEGDAGQGHLVVRGGGTGLGSQPDAVGRRLYYRDAGVEHHVGRRPCSPTWCWFPPSASSVTD